MDICRDVLLLFLASNMFLLMTLFVPSPHNHVTIKLAIYVQHLCDNI